MTALSIGADVERAWRRVRQFFSLTKPRVVSLIVFTAVIGMFLAVPGMVALPSVSMMPAMEHTNMPTHH